MRAGRRDGRWAESCAGFARRRGEPELGVFRFKRLEERATRADCFSGLDAGPTISRQHEPEAHRYRPSIARSIGPRILLMSPAPREITTSPALAFFGTFTRGFTFAISLSSEILWISRRSRRW